jgi:hypothetical protein
VKSLNMLSFRSLVSFFLNFYLENNSLICLIVYPSPFLKVLSESLSAHLVNLGDSFYLFHCLLFRTPLEASASHIAFIWNIIKCLKLMQNGYGFIALIYCN